MTTYGGLFEGYGGLTLGAQDALGGGRLAWYSEIEPAACRVLAHHNPGVPNLGDITAVDWHTVEPVDVLTGGFPCQDVSSAGKRAGLKPGTRSGLWSHMAYAISILRPRLVIAENVRGLLNAEAHSNVEPCPECVGDGHNQPHMRALGAVLADLANIGYDAAWCGLRAADVGAPHGRLRVFVVAAPADTGGETGLGGARLREVGAGGVGRGRPRNGNDEAAADPQSDGRHEGQPESARQFGRPDVAVGIAPTHEQFLPIAVERPRGRVEWGEYAPAVERWERILGRPAPVPLGRRYRAGRFLNPPFVEWMMGLPEGHVTDVPGVSRNEQLKMLGNGVVPQQAAAAVRFLLPALFPVEAAA